MAGALPPYGQRQASVSVSTTRGWSNSVCCSVYIHVDACVPICVHMHCQVTSLTGLMASHSCRSLSLSPSPCLTLSVFSLSPVLNEYLCLSPLHPTLRWRAKLIKRTFHFILRQRHHGRSAWAACSSERTTSEQDPRAQSEIQNKWAKYRKERGERGRERDRQRERKRLQEPNICVRRKVMSYLSDYY